MLSTMLFDCCCLDDYMMNMNMPCCLFIGVGCNCPISKKPITDVALLHNSAAILNCVVGCCLDADEPCCFLIEIHLMSVVCC